MEGTLNIILTDDDPDDRLLFKEALETIAVKHNYQEFEDGDELISYLNSAKMVINTTENTNLIFLDLNMPKLSGLQVLDEMKNQAWVNIVTIIWTTAFRQETADECFRLGAKQYVTKPDSFSELERKLTSIIHSYTF